MQQLSQTFPHEGPSNSAAEQISSSRLHSVRKWQNDAFHSKLNLLHLATDSSLQISKLSIVVLMKRCTKNEWATFADINEQFLGALCATRILFCLIPRTEEPLCERHCVGCCCFPLLHLGLFDACSGLTFVCSLFLFGVCSHRAAAEHNIKHMQDAWHTEVYNAAGHRNAELPVGLP